MKSPDKIVKEIGERIARQLADAPLGPEEEDAAIAVAELEQVRELIEAAQQAVRPSHHSSITNACRDYAERRGLLRTVLAKLMEE